MKVTNRRVSEERGVPILVILARGVTPLAKKWLLGWLASVIAFTPILLLAVPKGFSGDQSVLGLLCVMATIVSSIAIFITSVVMLFIVCEGIWIGLQLKYSGFFKKLSDWINKEGL